MIWRRSLQPAVLFFALAYGLTWIFWIPAGLIETGRLDLNVPTFLLQLLGGLGPMAAAMIVTARLSGRSGVGALFRRLLKGRVGLHWYVAALVLVPLLELPDLALHVASGQQLQLQDLVPLLLIVTPLHFLFVFLIGGGIDEEVGWRGFALTQLQARMHPAAANLVLGVLWSCWHLPLWFIPGTFQSEQSFLVYSIGVTAMSFLLAWIHNGTGGSLLLVVLAHSASDAGDNLRSNLLGGVSPTEATEYHLVRTGLTVLAAVVMLVVTRGRLGLSRAVEGRDAPSSSARPVPLTAAGQATLPAD